MCSKFSTTKRAFVVAICFKSQISLLKDWGNEGRVGETRRPGAWSRLMDSTLFHRSRGVRQRFATRFLLQAHFQPVFKTSIKKHHLTPRCEGFRLCGQGQPTGYFRLSAKDKHRIKRQGLETFPAIWHSDLMFAASPNKIMSLNAMYLCFYCNNFYYSF